MKLRKRFVAGVLAALVAIAGVPYPGSSARAKEVPALEEVQETEPVDAGETTDVSEDIDANETEDEIGAAEGENQGLEEDASLSVKETESAETDEDGEEEDEETYTLTYIVKNNGTASITGYEGTGSGDLVIPEEIDGYKVTSIGEEAFIWCDEFTGSLIIPSSVTSIGDSAFLGCSDLINVNISSGVTSIGDYAFSECGLANVSIPSSVISIGGAAFSGCSDLVSVNISSGVTSIGDYAFSECSGLTNVSIPSSVTSIGDAMFSECSGLTNINIPSSVTSIGIEAFSGCISLISVSIPSSVRNIESEAFSGCSSLTKVEILASVTDMGEDVFLGCNGLVSAGPIGGGYNLEFGWEKVIPAYAFFGCNSLASVNIPSGVISIGEYAFSGCSRLTSVKIPSTVTDIAVYMFEDCNQLTSAGPIGGGYTYEFGWEEMIPDNAFSGCSSLTSVKIPASVTSIGEDTFSGCSGLTSAGPIGGGYAYEFEWEKVIPANAFSGCGGLTSVNIPSSVTYIGYDAFSYCSSLASVNIPSSVISIGDNTFKCCDSLTSVNIPFGVTGIGDDAFSECSSLTTVSIPSSVIYIGRNAFFKCSSLTSMDIPPSVTGIGSNAFSGCSNLASVSIPSSVVYIGEDAFDECNALLSVQIINVTCSIYDSSSTIPENIKIYGYVNSTAESYAKKYSRTFVPIGTAEKDAVPIALTVLKEQTEYDVGDILGIDDNITVIEDIIVIANYTDGTIREVTGFSTNILDIDMSVAGKKTLVVTYQEDNITLKANIEINVKEKSEAVGSAYALTYAVVEESRTADIRGYKGTIEGELIIPEKINGYKVTGIGYSAFKDCTGITSISIPSGVTYIGGYAFSGCSGLVSVSIPSSVERIGDYAFSGCKGLTNVSILSGVTSMGEGVFSYCSGLTNAGPAGGGYDYEYGWEEAIPDNAFSGCRGLTSVSIPSGMTSIGYEAFRGCGSLTSVSIPSGVTSIDRDAFRGCDSLTSVSIPSSVTSIGYDTFSGCSGLTSAGPTGGGYDYEYGWEEAIPDNAFSGCSGLTSVNIPSSVTSIGSDAFQYCGSLTSVSIPSNVTYIGNNAFYDCSSLTYVNIPNGVTEIGHDVFSWCSSLTNLNIPSSVAYIREGAFCGCSGLRSISIPSSVEYIGRRAFGNCSGLSSILIFNSACEIYDSDSYSSMLENTTIFGYANSTAESYAEKHNRAFVSFESIGNDTVPIVLTASKEKTEYKTGEILNIDDIVVTAIYTDGTTKTVTGYTTNVSEIDMSVAGKECLLITYQEGKVELRTSIEIEVEEKIEVVAPYENATYMLKYIVKSNETVIIIGCERTASGDLVIPEKIGEHSVTSIGDDAFWCCSGLTGVTIPPSVMSIGEDAFYDCSGLSSISILNADCQIYDTGDTIPENAIIHGYADSTAQAYAEKHNRTFVSLDSTEVLPVQLTVLKEKNEYKTGESLNVDDITATVSYTDGTTKAVTGFATNVSEIDMSVAGKKVLTVTYQEKGVELEAKIEINVKETSEIIKPKYYTVTFDANGGTELSETSRTVEEGKTIGALPEEVQRVGYTFTGWYKEASCKNKWNFDTDVVTQDTVLYAGWEPVVVTYTVSFDLQGHGSIEGITVISGSKIERPSDPAADGYTFIGWYKEAACENQWNFDTDTVTGDLTLYAGWVKNKDSQDFGDVLPGDVPADEKIPEKQLWIVPIQDVTYTGKAVKPEVHIYWGKERLDEGVDYTLKYRNNTQANSGSDLGKAPQVAVKYKKHFLEKQQETIYFKIQPVNLADVTADDLTLAVSKKVQKKVPTATWLGKKLVKGKDFDVSYPDEGKSGAYQEKGEYTVLLTAGKSGNFTGSKAVRLTVTDLIPVSKVSVKVKSQLYDKGKPVEPEPKVTYKGKALEKDVDYTVSYQNNTEIGTASAVITGAGKYQGTKRVNFKITGTSIKRAAVSGLTEKEYTGAAQIPEGLTVALGGKSLKEGTDYSVSYTKNRNAGKATVIISGMGQYTGTVKKTFKIKAYDLKLDESKNENRLLKGLEDDISVSLSEYTKGICKPEPVLTFKGRVLRKGRDYTLSYKNNKKAATAADQKAPMIVIKGKGNFKGTVQKAFTITE